MLRPAIDTTTSAISGRATLGPRWPATATRNWLSTCCVATAPRAGSSGSTRATSPSWRRGTSRGLPVTPLHGTPAIWLYEGLVGLKRGADGWQRFTVTPAAGQRLTTGALPAPGYADRGHVPAHWDRDRWHDRGRGAARVDGHPQAARSRPFQLTAGTTSTGSGLSSTLGRARCSHHPIRDQSETPCSSLQSPGDAGGNSVRRPESSDTCSLYETADRLSSEAVSDSDAVRATERGRRGASRRAGRHHGRGYDGDVSGRAKSRGPRPRGGRPGPRSWWKVVASVTTAFALCTRRRGPQGISHADLGYVFFLINRVEESRSMPGSGLGLSIVRQVCRR